MSTEQIKLTVNPAKRVLEYNGTPLLGVVGDDCAQRIFFECPKSINEFIDDMTSDNITVFIDYKNAYGEPYIQECAKPVTFNESTVTFSWVVTKFATAKAGNVSFNVCVKKTVDGVLENEWHTTDIQGKILPKVDTSNKTLEVITHDTVTVEALILEVAALKSTLQDTEEYINGEVESQVSDEMNKYNTRLDPVYVTGNTVFNTNLLNFDSFVMSFYVDKRNVDGGVTYFYQNSEVGKQGTTCGYVSYAEITDTHNTYNMHYTIRGTRVANDFQGTVTYLIEFIANDENGYDNEVMLSSNTLITVVDGVDYLGFSIDSTASNQYLVGRRY